MTTGRKEFQAEESDRQLRRDVEVWRSEHESSRLVHFVTEDSLIVFDGRSCAADQVHLLESDMRTVFESCADIRTLASLERLVGKARANRAVDELADRHLLLRIGDRVLSPSLRGETLAANDLGVRGDQLQRLRLDKEKGALE